MNEERIDEIAFEAGCHRHKYWDPKHPDLEGFIISQAALDKFAELILTEVISTIYRSDISDKKQEKLVDELAYKFGMK